MLSNPIFVGVSIVTLLFAIRYGYYFKNVDSEKMSTKETRVVIIGSGPAAMSLAFMLEGHQPMYEGMHPIAPLHDILTSSKNKRRLDNVKILKKAAGGLRGRSETPVSLLWDQLAHPLADMQMEVEAPRLNVRLNESRAIDYVMIGKDIGGSWAHMWSDLRTLSPAHWMLLPGAKRKRLPETRQQRDLILEYYKEYTAQRKSFVQAKVTHLARNNGDKALPWRVECDNGDVFLAAHVVLATGIFSIANELQIPGEHLKGVVSHRFVHAEKGERLLVVGAGLSAADCILRALRNGAHVTHVFRRRARDPEQKLAKFAGDEGDDEDGYGDYADLFARMHRSGVQRLEDDAAATYEAIEFAELREISQISSQTAAKSDSDPLHESGDIEKKKRKKRKKAHREQSGVAGLQCRVVTRDDDDGAARLIEADRVAILIGAHADFSFIDDVELRERLGTRDVDVVDRWSFEIDKVLNLYAIGSLIKGDNFVRFLTGHALAVRLQIEAKEAKNNKK